MLLTVAIKGRASVLSQIAVNVRFYPPPEDLRRYFTTFYHTTINLPEGATVKDALQPEWANMRIFESGTPTAWVEGGPVLTGSRMVVTGPTSRAINFEIPATRMWGIGLLPLGWARFMPREAALCANSLTCGYEHPDCAPFRVLADKVFQGEPCEEAELARIIAFFRAVPPAKGVDADRIQRIHNAIVDPAIGNVKQLVDQVRMGQRTIERVCARAFGFSPKVLLRRQRFMRSLTQYMLDPSLKWIGAIDSHYHDQAQFVRDFREFMGTTPREYAARPHPILERFMQERMRVHGSAVQTTDRPDGTLPSSVDAPANAA